MGTYYKNVEQFLDRIDAGDWLEIGIDRGEGSTPWLADQAKSRNQDFFAVDVDPNQIQITRQRFIDQGQMSPKIFFVLEKGEDFIKNFAKDHPERRFSLAYLDNFDWDYWLGVEEEEFVPKIKKQYQDIMNVEMLNINSQISHLYQAMLLAPLMTANSIFVCDDTWYHPEEGVFIGKCSSVVPYLIMIGYQVLHTDGYRQNSGVILGKFK